ncbi:hypothetical protein [Stutzerimonas stutzeri]|uniref:DUF4126 domain-containing protein n=1 Tax=Stutzerimonas stutzeri KOS6 TaxID=1218352 RepID=A0A061JLJ7_STUST|nr:hypothetical protein [Stutzerimonas stutzeri]EWC39059.1 hypothetical protein B597_022120 [Stutzerimonas stutzeri KOS6]
MSTSSNLFWAALAIGAVTGMRSLLAPTMVSRALTVGSAGLRRALASGR